MSSTRILGSRELTKKEGVDLRRLRRNLQLTPLQRLRRLQREIAAASRSARA